VSRLDDALREVQDELRKERAQMNFRALQLEVDDWASKNFGVTRPPWHQILGAVEEIGELSHAYLKREQKIRGTYEEHTAAISDAVADVIIFLANFCCTADIDLQETVEAVWTRVKARDWTKNALHGGDVASHRELHPNESGELELAQLGNTGHVMPITRESAEQLDRMLHEQTHGAVRWLPEDTDQLREGKYVASRHGIMKLARHGLMISDDGTIIDMNKVEEQQAQEAEREALGVPDRSVRGDTDQDIPF
jgi:NTP pyrophosphatase (non-canonical NTP hydrolase)